MDVWTMGRGKLVGIVASLILTEIAWMFYKKCKSSTNNNSNKNGKFTKVLFFTDESVLCRTHVAKAKFNCLRKNCPVSHINMIIDHIKSATLTVDVCVYFLTHHDLVKAIIHAFKRKVIVRIITDWDMSKENRTELIKLKKAGIKLRAKKSGNLMHHKFAIVDQRLLITGSTNWTSSAFFGNFENIIITTQYEFVNAFTTEFERLWSMFDA